MHGSGKRAERFIGASSFCAIRGLPETATVVPAAMVVDGVTLLATGAAEKERRELSGRRGPRRVFQRAGVPRAESARRADRPAGQLASWSA
jgi:hypothetical protein